MKRSDLSLSTPRSKVRGRGRSVRATLVLSFTASVATAGCGGTNKSVDAGRLSGGDASAVVDGSASHDGGSKSHDGGVQLDAGPALAVTLTGAARPIAPDDFGLNGSTLASSQGWDTTGLVQATAALGPKLIRFPAGGNSETWDWAHSWFFVNYEPRSTNTSGYDFASYAQAATQIGNRTITVLDLVTRPTAVGSTTGAQASYPADSSGILADQAAMVQAEKAAGIEVDRVELGNEVYLHYTGNMMVDKSVVFPDGASYATETNKWVASLHSRFPGIHVGLSLVQVYSTNCSSTQGQRKRECEWDEEVLPAEVGADAGILHLYFGSGATSPTVEDFLALPSHYWQQLSAAGGTLSQLSRAHLTAWITEMNYSISDTGMQAYTGSWAHALGLASFDLQAFASPVVEVVIEQSLYSGYPFGHILAASWGHNGKPAFADFARSAIGASYALIAASLQGETKAQGIRVVGAPQLEGHDAVVGLALGHGGSFDHVVAVNLSADPASLDLGSVLGSNLSGTVLTPPSGDPTQIIPDGVQDVTRSMPSTSGSVVTMPPYALADWHR